MVKNRISEQPSPITPTTGNRHKKHCPPYDHTWLIQHLTVPGSVSQQHAWMSMHYHQQRACIPRGLYLVASCDGMKPNH